MQCVNDPLIYAIETTSAIIVKTIRFADDYHNTLELRNTFTISPCGSLIFTKCAHDDQIKCIRISNEEVMGQFRIPISLTTKQYAVTSLSYHPSKDLIACSIFGDTIHSCLFLLCHETDDINKRQGSIIQNKDDINWEHDLNTLQQWYNNRSYDMTNIDGVNEIALDSILNRIDDLFFMAIRSPKIVSDNDQFKEMQIFFQKMCSKPSQVMPSNDDLQSQDHNQNDEKNSVQLFNDEHIDNTFAKHTQMSFKMKTSANVSSKSTDTQSNSSRHTFNIKKPTTLKQTIEKNADMQSNESETSNRTFEIQK